MSPRKSAALVAAVIFLVSLPACTISTKQVFDLGVRAIDAIKKKESLNAEKWSLRFAGSDYALIRTDIEEGQSLFYDSAGLRIVFNGREITSVEGLPGAMGPIAVRVLGNKRRYERGGNRSFEVSCNEPFEWRFEAIDQTGWRVRCWGELNGVPVYVQQETKWSSGNRLTTIRSTLIPGASQFVLRRLTDAN